MALWLSTGLAFCRRKFDPFLRHSLTFSESDSNVTKLVRGQLNGVVQA